MKDKNPATSVEILRQSLVKGGESRSTFVPPTSIEQADELINEEHLSLLEHDNAKYPLDEQTQREKRKGNKRQTTGVAFIPEIEGFDEHELKEASSMVDEEIQYLRVAMGHENESFVDFVKSHDACQEDLMFFPMNNSYGLASVAGNADKISALQHEFEIVKKRMDDEAKKASRLEQKIKLLTQGYQARAAKLGSQIQDTFKQMNTAATELECFQELQKQEQMAGAYRVRNLAEEVNKQKALERTLQSRYGDLLSGHQRIQEQLAEYKKQLKLQEAAMEAERRAKEEAVEAEKRAEEESVQGEKCAKEEAVEAEKRAKEEVVEVEKRAEEEAVEADKHAKEEEAAAQNHAAEEENEKKKSKC
ncbi:cell division cycle 5-like protein [Lolium rigidum]|uniref:cell division cycle 5-like protein n=1 Tax=Lolium rigidum TaxID=89674 RepID=UPI001F5D1CA8|nr:cell division cycle 5-like protein [Lolium rigidum]